MTRKIPPFPRLTGRCYFFPALLPLAELAPWLLAVLGAVTGIAGASPAALWRRQRRKILTGSLLCFLAAGALIYSAIPAKLVREEGTQLLPPEHFPKAQIFHPAPETAALPAPDTFGELWTRQTSRQILSTPVIAQNQLIFGSYQGSVEALALKDGKPLWSLPQSAFIFSLALGPNGILFASSGLHETRSAIMTALLPAQGQPLWQREFLGHIENPPAVEKDRLWLGAGPGGVWALKAQDGALLWHAPLGHVDSTPLVFKDTLYVPGQPDETRPESRLYALDADDGDVRWQCPLPGQPWGSPQIDKSGQRLLISSGIGQIGVNKDTDRGWAQAVNAADGKILWQKDLPGMAIQPDVYLSEDDTIIYTLKTGELIALDARSGAIRWRAKVGQEFQSGAALLRAGGEALIAATSFDGVFTIRRAASGEELARRAVGKYATAAPVFANGNVYVASAYTVTAFGGVAALLRSR